MDYKYLYVILEKHRKISKNVQYKENYLHALLWTVLIYFKIFPEN